MVVSIWLTGRCNLNCKYCYVEGMKKSMDFSTKFIDHFLRFLKQYDDRKEKLQINFFGGEPLLCFDTICQIVEKFDKEYDRPAVFGMTTNGLLLDKQKISFLKEKQFQVSLSWDGCREANDRNRICTNGEGTYERIKQSYLLLKNSGLESLRVRATFNCDTYQYLEKSISEFEEIDGEMSAFFSPDYFDPNWTEEQLEELGVICRKISEKQCGNIMILGDPTLISCRCSGGINSFHVYMDGKIYPCSFVVGQEQFSIGDLKNGLNQERVNELTCEYGKRLESCKGCDNEFYCLSFKCRYLNQILTGRMDETAPIVCHFEHLIKGSSMV